MSMDVSMVDCDVVVANLERSCRALGYPAVVRPVESDGRVMMHVYAGGKRAAKSISKWTPGTFGGYPVVVSAETAPR